MAKNIVEAVTLHLEDEDTAEFGLVAKPTIILTFELYLQKIGIKLSQPAICIAG